MPEGTFVKIIFTFIMIILTAARVFWPMSKEQICNWNMSVWVTGKGPAKSIELCVELSASQERALYIPWKKGSYQNRQAFSLFIKHKLNAYTVPIPSGILLRNGERGVTVNRRN